MYWRWIRHRRDRYMQPLYGHLALKGCQMQPDGNYQGKHKHCDREHWAYACNYSGNQEHKVCKPKRKRYQQIEDIRIGLPILSNVKYRCIDLPSNLRSIHLTFFR